MSSIFRVSNLIQFKICNSEQVTRNLILKQGLLCLNSDRIVLPKSGSSSQRKGRRDPTISKKSSRQSRDLLIRRIVRSARETRISPRLKPLPTAAAAHPIAKDGGSGLFPINFLPLCLREG